MAANCLSQAERDALVRDNLDLAAIAANLYRRWGTDLDDLRSEATVALVRASQTFDPDQGVPFRPYAMTAMKWAASRYALKNRGIVAAPSQIGRVLGLAAKAEAAALADGTMTDDEIEAAAAKAAGVPVDTLRTFRRMIRKEDRSLDDSAGRNDSRTLLEVLVDDTMGPEEAARLSIDAQRLREAIERHLQEIPERERVIVERRLLAEEPLGLAALGEMLGITKERVRQLEKRAVLRLQRAMRREFALTMWAAA